MHQQTRTVKVPTVCPSGRSNVTRKPHDLLSSSCHGSCRITSAGNTTRMLSPVWKWPTTGCNKHILSRGVTIPKIPHTAANFCRTALWRKTSQLAHNMLRLDKSLRLPGRVVLNLAPYIDKNSLVGKSCIAPSNFVNQQGATQTVRAPNQLLICGRA